MTNLNLSNDAVEFIGTLDRKQAMPLWNRLSQLLEGDSPGDVADFGEGKLFTTVNEFIFILRFDQDTVYIETIGRRYDALNSVEALSQSNQYSAAGSVFRNLGIEPNLAELFALSFVALFFALTIERWFTFDLSPFAALQTIPLVVCLAGTSIGVWMRSERLYNFMPASLLLAVLITLFVKQYGLCAGGYVSTALLNCANGFSAPPSSLLIVLSALLLCLIGPFGFATSLGSRLSRLTASYPPLTGYGTIVLGAFFSYLSFTLSSALCWTPAYQITAMVVTLVLLAGRALSPRFLMSAGLILAAGAMFSPLAKSAPEVARQYFSPYHKIALLSASRSDNSAVTVVLDDSTQQILVPIDSETSSAPIDAIHQKPSASYDALKTFQRLPFAFKHPKDVLILNAGIGADLEEAVRQGAQSIDAVEIDPVLLKLGKRYNPVYGSPSVHAQCQDPRDFVNNCHKKYDMIIAACQHFVRPIGLAAGPQQRYQYTQEFYKKCLSLLNPHGILLTSYSSSQKDTGWLSDRIFATLKAASGITPSMVGRRESDSSGFSPYLFAVAPSSEALSKCKENAIYGDHRRMLLANETFADPMFDGYTFPVSPGNARVATDDCPFIFFEPGTIDIFYISLVAILIAVVSLFGRPLILSTANVFVDWQVFLLNAALISMVLGSLPRLVTMYGSGWLTYAIIFGGILLIAWLAYYSMRRPAATQYEIILYVGLFITLTLSCILPTQWLASLGVPGCLLIIFFTVMPMFRVLLILPAAYSEAEELAPLFALGLLGLSTGILLKYISFYLGQNSLLLISVVLFGFSCVLGIRGQKVFLPPIAKLSTKRIT